MKDTRRIKLIKMELQVIIGKKKGRMKTRGLDTEDGKILSILMDFKVQGTLNLNDRYYYYTNAKKLSNAINRDFCAQRFYIHMTRVKNPQEIYQALLKEGYSLVDSKIIPEKDYKIKQSPNQK